MSETNSQGLKRNVGLFAAICLMTGCVVGASVFIVPGELSASTEDFTYLGSYSEVV